jgi:PAS domain S-box-containing protein
VLVILACSTIVFFESDSASSQEAARQAARVNDLSQDAQIYEWQLGDKPVVTAEDRSLADAKIASLNQSMAKLQILVSPKYELSRISRVVTAYGGHIENQAALLQNHQLAAAKAYDAKFTDPTGDWLNQALSDLERRLSNEASRARSISTWIALGALIVTVLASLLISWGHQRAEFRYSLKSSLNEAAAANERRLAAILSRASSLIVITDRFGVIREARGGYGSTLSTVTSKVDECLADLFASSHLSEFQAMLSMASSTPSPTVEFPIQINGETLRVECVVVDYSGEDLVRGMLWTIKNVTARYNAELELRETHARLNSILEECDIAVWSADAATHQILFVSQSCAQIFGLEAGDFYADPMAWARAAHPDDVDRPKQMLSDLQEKGEGQTTYRICRPDGEVRWLTTTGHAVKRESGEVIRFEGFVQDRTAEKSAMAALEESTLRHEKILRNVPGLVFQYRLDAQGNHSFPFYSGGDYWLTDEFSIIQQDPNRFTDWVHPDDRASLLASIQNSAQRMEPFRWEGRGSRPSDGQELWFQIASHPQRSRDGSVIWDGIVLDITEHKQVEQMQRKADAAEEANRAKSQFLSRMSHELRTPLNSILGFGQLLEMSAQSDDERLMLGHLIKGGRHLLGLVNDVLDISRVESGPIELSTEPIELDPLIEEALDLMEPLAAEMGVTLTYDREPNPQNLYVLSDSQRLRQVFLNLISNGIKYNHVDGSVVIRCAATDNDMVQIRVVDTGPGIPLDKRNRLYMPFDRLGAEQSSVEGTGLGLAMSRNLSRTMGGDLWLEDSPTGASFVCELARSEAPKVDLSAPCPVGADLSQTQGMILSIEDNFSNTRLMETMATYMGVRLQTSAQGQLGFEAAKSLQPDIILLDLDLPDVSGMEVLTFLKECRETAEIPVIIVSADANPQRARRALENGAIDYITKPFDVPDMIEVLRNHLDRQVTAA